MRKSINWCVMTRMPFTDDMFTRLARREDINLNVLCRYDSIGDYPFTDIPTVIYNWRSLSKRKERIRIMREAWSAKETTWVVAGWGDSTYAFLLVVLSVLRRDFIIHSDAPVPEGRTGSLLKRGVRRLLLKLWFQQCRAVITTGDFAVTRFEAMGTASDKIVSIPCPLDEERFAPGPNYAKGAGTPVILACSGRLDVKHKRQDLVIRAVKRLTEGADPLDIVLRIAGSGKDESFLLALVTELGIGDRVEFLGWLDQRSLTEFYGSAHIYLHPADFEPYGVTLVEALYSGLYVVASQNVGAAVELVDGNRNGLLFETGSLGALEDAIRTAYKQIVAGAVTKEDVRAASNRWPIERQERATVATLFGPE